jgi:hypothetical protein
MQISNMGQYSIENELTCENGNAMIGIRYLDYKQFSSQTEVEINRVNILSALTLARVAEWLMNLVSLPSPEASVVHL